MINLQTMKLMKMKRVYAILFTLTLLCTGFVDRRMGVVVVSPDGVLKTPLAAVQKIRSMRSQGILPRNDRIVVSLESGTYAFSEPLVLDDQDSGIHFEGKGSVVFEGGIQLPAFSVASNGIWKTDVPEGLDFEQLYIGSHRAQRARTPNCGFLYMKEKDELLPSRAFYANPADIAGLKGVSQRELNRVAIEIWQSWDNGWGNIDSIDFKTGRVVENTDMLRPLFFWNRTCPRYALENYRGALDAPGEWFLDIESRCLLYIPLPGERPETTRAFAPRSEGLIVIRGDRKSGKVASDISFRGIEFLHARYRLGREGKQNWQAAHNVRSAVIWAEGAQDVCIENCRIAHAGAHGVRLGRECRHCRVKHALIEDLGGGGVYFGDTKWDRTRRDFNAADLIVEDSIIRKGGRTFEGSIGVWIGHAHGCAVIHNDISDFYYTGVSSGWTWGYKETINQDNRIAFNHIRHIGQGRLSDLGGVYMLGDGTGSVVEGNWIEDVNGYLDNGASAYGLYTDEGARGILFTSNLVTHCRAGAVNQHYGRENVHANSIFAYFGGCGVRRSRNEGHLTMSFFNNIFYWTDSGTPVFSGYGMTGNPTNIRKNGNVYWCTSGDVASEEGGVVADPCFVDPSRGDWRLQSGSPAIAQGFKQFDWTDAGVCRSDVEWRKTAESDGYVGFEDSPKAPTYALERVNMDFEHIPEGELTDVMQGLFPFFLPGTADGLFVGLEKDSGRGKVLEFQDSPLFSATYLPSVYLKCCITADVACISFRFKGDVESMMQFEARDYHNQDPFVTGLSLLFSHGMVRCRGREICRYSAGWNDVEIEMHLTGDSGEWHVRIAGADSRSEYKGKDWIDACFKEVTWIGFMSPGKDSVWCLDDFKLRRRKARE